MFRISYCRPLEMSRSISLKSLNSLPAASIRVMIILFISLLVFMNDVFTLNSAKIHFSIEIPLVQNGSISGCL